MLKSKCFALQQNTSASEVIKTTTFFEFTIYKLAILLLNDVIDYFTDTIAYGLKILATHIFCFDDVTKIYSF